MKLLNKELTKRVAEKLPDINLSHWPGNRVPPRQLWRILFGYEPNVRQVAELGRSLEALGWRRSAARGVLVFIPKGDMYGPGT